MSETMECQNCRFYDSVTSTCRKNSPKPIVVSIPEHLEHKEENAIYKAVWPEVRDDDYCGEFVSIETENAVPAMPNAVP